MQGSRFGAERVNRARRFTYKGKHSENKEDARLTTIAPFLNGHAPFFDLETTRAMSLAFDEVCGTLNIPASASARVKP
jgi:hypothetical protein